MTEQQLNDRVAEQICRDLEYEGLRFKNGQCVALLDGHVVGVAQTLDDAAKMLDSVVADPLRGMIVEVGPTPADVIRRAS